MAKGASSESCLLIRIWNNESPFKKKHTWLFIEALSPLWEKIKPSHDFQNIWREIKDQIKTCISKDWQCVNLFSKISTYMKSIFPGFPLFVDILQFPFKRYFFEILSYYFEKVRVFCNDTWDVCPLRATVRKQGSAVKQARTVPRSKHCGISIF